MNSTQSLRIRTLESEISRLLSENIALRERVISLQYEVDKRSGCAALADMGTVKEKLEAKLTELGGLVQDLGRIQVAAINPRSPKRKSMNQNESKRSPDQKNWKNNLTLSEVTAGGDGRLPPIVEDKYFPRKTLEYVRYSGRRKAEGLLIVASVLRSYSGSLRASPTLPIPQTSGHLQSPTLKKETR